MDCSTPGLPVHHQLHSLLKLMSIESVMPSNHLILCCPLLLPPSIFPTIKVFSNESVLHNRWPKYWSFSFNISPSNEYSGLISFRIDWLDLLAVQGVAKSKTQLSNWTDWFTTLLPGPLEKKMATHFSILAWRIPWTEEPRGIQSMGSQESDTT